MEESPKGLTLQKAIEMRRAEQFEQERIRKRQGELVFGKVTPDELMELYKKWDYKYKPEYLYFSRTFNELVMKDYDFLKYLEDARRMAYYSSRHTDAEVGFMQLACLIYLAMAKRMETPYDHVLNSDKDFELKLNSLHTKK